jgi:thiamine monophosphate kinase
MPKYVVISNHPPMSCPSANKTLRDTSDTLGTDIQNMLQKHKIKAEAILHLDPGHKIVWILEAPSAEAVRDFYYDSGMTRWNDFEFYMASSLEEVTSWIQHLPTIW